jgi:DnaJ-class molecular chaperone
VSAERDERDVSERWERYFAEDEVECPHCGGSGMVGRWDLEESCPVCGGVGWTLDDEGDDGC